MNAKTDVIDVTDEEGRVVASDWLVKAEAIHRELRPHLPRDYAAKMHRVFAGGGRMCVAARSGEAVGVAVYRIHENTFDGVHMYVDDLVTAERARSSGVGSALMEHMQRIAIASACATYTLDSGTQRTQAHKFYFREGMTVVGFHFVKPLARHPAPRS